MKYLTAFAIVVSLSLTEIPAAVAQVATGAPTVPSPSEIDRQMIQRDKVGYVTALVSRWESDARASAKWDSNSNYSTDMFSALMRLGPDNLLLAGQATSFQALMDVLKVGTQPISSDQLGSVDDLVYTPVNPCRIVDTRNIGGGFGTPVFSGTTRLFDVDNPAGFAFQGGNPGPCGIPFGVALAVQMNITVTPYPPAPTAGYLTAWGLGPQPFASIINYTAGETIANSTVIPVVPGIGNDFSIFAFGTTHVIIDVQGYYAVSEATALDNNVLRSDVAVAGGLSSYSVFSPICPTGYRLTGGGGVTDSYTDNAPVGSRPVADNSVAFISGFNVANQWLVQGNTLGKGATTIHSWAICSRVPGR